MPAQTREVVEGDGVAEHPAELSAGAAKAALVCTTYAAWTS